MSLPSIAALHPDRPDELAAGAAALRDGRVADAVSAYDRALEHLSPDGHPEQRGDTVLDVLLAGNGRQPHDGGTVAQGGFHGAGIAPADAEVATDRTEDPHPLHLACRQIGGGI